ncbi:MAG: class I SAM-dependent DNA methyltransferase [Promethearchaeota archaeon]
MTDRPEDMGDFYSQLAQYYDDIYTELDYEGAAHKIHALVQKYKTTQGNNLLDVACGTGAHILYLKDRYNPVGLDLSEEMLEVARKKCPDVEFVQGNMTSFDLGQKFDVITCLFGSIGYLTTQNELADAISTFSRHMFSGGVLIIEPIFTRETVRAGFMGISCLDLPDIKIARVNVSRIEGDLAYLDFNFLIATKERGVEHFIDPSPMGIFPRDTYISLMEKNGFNTDFVEPGLMKEGLFVGVKT